MTHISYAETSSMDANPVLSICVPTFNRPQLLEECLQSIVRSLEGIEDTVEIVISDNASEKATAEVATRFVRNHQNASYFRNERNVLDENFYLAMERARGRFVWVLGDDDQITADAIRLVLEKVRAGHDLIICQYSVMSPDFSRVLQKRGLPIASPSLLNDRDAVLAIYSTTLGFISCSVTHRQRFLSVPTAERDRFMECGASFLYCVYASAPVNCRPALIESPVVLYRSGIARFDDDHWVRTFVIGLASAVHALAQYGYSTQAIRKARNKNILYNVIRRLVLLKMNNRPLQAAAAALAANYRDCPQYWLQCRPVLLLPRWSLALARAMKRAIGNSAAAA